MFTWMVIKVYIAVRKTFSLLYVAHVNGEHHFYVNKYFSKLMNLPEKFKQIVAFVSPFTFWAATRYLPASSTVTFVISSVQKYKCVEWISLSTRSYRGYEIIIITKC